MPKRIAVIGSGFAGLGASAILAANGHDVHVFEKNAQTGGRARRMSEGGFHFDMGPSWYWMPDVFEKFYNRFGHTASDFYELKLLDPGFSIVFGENELMEIPADYEALRSLFEQTEKGAAAQLDAFMKGAAHKYEIGINDLVYQPGLSLREFARFDVLKNMLRLQVFSSFSKHVRRYFKDPRLVALMEFPVLFLGAMPAQTPALYSLMNYAGLKLGTWYPMGGMGKIVEAMQQIAEKQGAVFHTAAPVTKLGIGNGEVNKVTAGGTSYAVDGVIGAADYHHMETALLPEAYRNYSEAYWEKRTFAPSSLLFFLGVNTTLPKLRHHTLFFDEDLDQHAQTIYVDKKWPEKPLFYACCTSKTDPSVAPAGMENLFLLIPIAPGLEDTAALREHYYELLLQRLEKFCGIEIRSHVVVKKSYCVSDFISDYHAYKGNAYGLANTLRQTAVFKPSMRSKKLNNLFFAGQLTVPGPGVPPAIISGQVAAAQLLKQFQTATL